MQACLAEFFDTRVFGPDRARLLAAATPAGDADAASRREHQTAELTKRLQRIDAAENAHAREIEHLATLPPDSPAVAALRTRILARFAELETERTQINAKLGQLAAIAPAAADPALLDRLPQVPGILCHAPADLQQELYRIFGAQMIYNHEVRPGLLLRHHHPGRHQSRHHPPDQQRHHGNVGPLATCT